MLIESRHDALIQKHRRIEARLAEEMKRPLPNAFAVQRLKRQKLMVKDEIQSCKRLMDAFDQEPMSRPGRRYA